MRTIKVTAEHIANGKRGSCQPCPVALALKDATGHLWNVTNQYCEYQFGSLILALPQLVREFIMDFDAGYSERRVKPFEFELPLPATD